MITKGQCLSCVCVKCKHQWITKNLEVPGLCSKCKTAKWNTDYIEPKPEPQKTLSDHVRELSATDRLMLFESFELCCGMNRGSCICEGIEKPKVSEPIVDERKTILEALQAKIAGIESGTNETKTAPIDDNWIEMPTTIEDGQTLYWHKKPKGYPVCYKRETNWDSFA